MFHFISRSSSTSPVFVWIVLLYLAKSWVITDGQPYSFLPPGPSAAAVPQPEVLSKGEVFHAQIGDTVLLPCKVKNLGPMILLWKKGTRVLTAGEMMIRRADKIILKGTDLQVQNVSPEDGGIYSCEIEADSEYPLVVTHTLEVLVPPTLHLDPSNQKIVVRSGTTVALRCKASGNPAPKIIWRKRNDRLPAGEISDGGTSFSMSDVTWHHTGAYECEADNGVGPSVKAEIKLQILYEPEVSAERSIVLGGLGLSAELTCVVYADPPADVVWYRETMRLDPNGKRYMESRGSKHTLIIRKIEKEDFANYSCYATNTLGRAKAFVYLRGNPNRPVFNSQVLSKSQTTYKISWITESFAPIEEYRLLYRKLPNDSMKHDMTHAWHNLRLPPRNNNNNVNGAAVVESGAASGAKSEQFHEFYTLGPLLPDSSYEAKVSAKNVFGWSESSNIFQFYTQGKGTSPYQNFVKNPEVQDMGLSSSSAVGGSGAILTSSAVQLINSNYLTTIATTYTLCCFFWTFLQK